MDFDSLSNQVRNLTVSDIKAGWRKAQNAVMNYTEMEAKVREATNNEPWGASSTQMQEIANGTFNYASLSEIMPMIYKRFTEKSAEEWRQIYKALQLLEFLIKNGSERVIDDARSHMSLLKMLRQFHYMDQNGKDQGINVRNRSKELCDLLADVDRIRAERKKARATRNKYGGTEGGIGVGPMSGGRYGGFGNDSGGGLGGGYGGFSGGVYGDGGGFGGQESASDYSTTQSRRDRFDEYDEYDDGGITSPAARRNPPNRTTPAAKPEPPKKEPEVDLFEFGEDDISAAPIAPPKSNGKAPAPSALDDFGTMQSSSGGGALDDDFDDFQQATPTNTAAKPLPAANILSPAQSTINNSAIPPPAAPINAPSSIPLMSPPASNPTRPTSTANYGAFHAPAPASTPLASTPLQSPPVQTNQPKSTGYQPQGPNYFGSITAASTGTSNSSSVAPNAGMASTGSSTAKPMGGQAAKKPASGSDPFASLAMGGPKKTANQKGPTMAEITKQKADQALWGAPAQQSGGGSGGNLI
ncbi:MAG: hypothetical protein Q9159_000897 [Coniocarpon cinnabarinum]